MLGRIGGGFVLSVLLVRLILAVAQLLHGQMLGWGQEMWPGYAEMRPGCEAPETPGEPGDATTPAAIDLPANAAGAEDDDLIDDLLGDDDADPAAATPTDGDALDALIDEAGEDGAEPATAAMDSGEPPSAAVTAAAAGDDDDLLGDDDLLDDDLLSDLGDAPVAGEPPATGAGAAPPPAVRPELRAKMTDGFMRYCRFEKQLSHISATGISWMTSIMVLLLLVAGVIASARRSHIGLRNARTPLSDRVRNISELVANLVVAWSAYAIIDLADPCEEYLQVIWVVGMLAMAAVNVVHLARPLAPGAEPPGNAFGRALAVIPLYAWMGIIGGLYFIFVEDHPAGIAIYLQKLTEYASLYIQVGLYLWTGMLLRDTRLGRLSFDVLRPLGLPAGMFAFIVVILAAVPTAYSGASGILVLALGATIYSELRRAGARDSLARAATAMSGSFGVVLPPCLLVVIVASLNLEVTTDELYYWGWRVFGLTAIIFLVISWMARTEPWRIAPKPGAAAASGTALRGLLPYVLIFVAVLVIFRVVLNVGLDEQTAPYILPIVMLLAIPWDRRAARKDAEAGIAPPPRGDTSLDTGTNVGALLLLMGLSAVLGGVIERSEIISMFPQDFGGPAGAMVLIMVALVIIGMIMDPYGAVILVSVTIYPIALQNGIHPLNFWMTALVSFELGYLTPPVALNHLLTRQVVSHLPGHEEEDPPPEGANFYRRHERILLPIAVRLTTLLIVAFGPIYWMSS